MLAGEMKKNETFFVSLMFSVTSARFPTANQHTIQHNHKICLKKLDPDCSYTTSFTHSPLPPVSGVQGGEGRGGCCVWLLHLVPQCSAKTVAVRCSQWSDVMRAELSMILNDCGISVLHIVPAAVRSIATILYISMYCSI